MSFAKTFLFFRVVSALAIRYFVKNMGLLVSHDTCTKQCLTAAAKQSVLDGQPTLDKIAERLRSGAIKRVVIISGAGTSVAAGIPDFRSPNTGSIALLVARIVLT